MKQFQKKINFKIRDVLFLFAVIMMFIVVISISNKNPVKVDSDISVAMENWKDDHGADVDLNELPIGESVSLSKDIGGINLTDKNFCLKSVDTVFDVYADGNLIYSYHPTQPKLLGASYGMYIHTIPIPEGTQILNLRADPIFPNSYVTIENVVIEDSGDYITNFYKDNVIAFSRSAITMLIGMLFIILGITNGVVSKSAGVDLFSFGMMCALLGFLGFNDTLMLQIQTQHPEMIRLLTYLGLIFVPYPAVSFFASATGNKKSKLPIVVLILCAVNLITSVTLTTLGITDYFQTVSVSHMIIGIGFAAVIYMMIIAFVHHTARFQLLVSMAVSFGICIIGMSADLLRYHLGSYDGYSKYTRISILFFMMIIGVYLLREQVRSLEQKQQENMTFISEMTESFAKVIDMKDQYTNGHSVRVAKYTVMLARELGYDEETIEQYYRIALLHDIGKIGVPSEVLNKPGKLTDEEYEIIKAHSQKGYEILKNISIMPELAIGAGSHHERPDGKGYPNGLKGDEIPRVAQIIAVADTFDAMYSNRPYRKRMNFEKAVTIIKEASGTQLSEDVVAAFLRLVEQGNFRAADDNGGGTTENIDNIHKRLAEEAT